MYSCCGVIIRLGWTMWAAFDFSMAENQINTSCCIDH